MKAYQAVERWWRMGDASHVLPAVWEETDRTVASVIAMERSAREAGLHDEHIARLAGTMLGLVFARRELYYDLKVIAPKKGTAS